MKIWEKKNVCLALGSDFKVAGRFVSENWPPYTDEVGDP